MVTTTLDWNTIQRLARCIFCFYMKNCSVDVSHGSSLLWVSLVCAESTIGIPFSEKKESTIGIALPFSKSSLSFLLFHEHKNEFLHYFVIAIYYCMNVMGSDTEAACMLRIKLRTHYPPTPCNVPILISYVTVLIRYIHEKVASRSVAIGNILKDPNLLLNHQDS